MNSFKLTRSTRLVCPAPTSAIGQAMDVLRRDQRNILTDDGTENAVVLTADPSLAPEGWTMRVTPETIDVRYADDLGAVYALLHISETHLGLHPLFFWNDQPLPKKPCAGIPCGTEASVPARVKYRGWFINDEVLLDPWKKGEQARREVWRMAFETILRCGGNMVIPGTDRHGDGLDMLAASMGLILTQHHAELLGAEMFGRVWPELPGSYRLHPDKFERLWRDAAEKYRDCRVIYAIGFRGQGDGAFWHEDPDFDTNEKRGREISRIMRRQMEIVRQVSPDALFCTNLYGEMMALYREGWLDLPEGVIKIWADNGFGRMLSRRQGNYDARVDAMPRHESGENGVYYHASFYDLQAANHITQLQVPSSLVADELNAVLANGADTYWIINSGSIKPHMYILDLIRHAWQTGHVDVEAHAAAYARTYFGSGAVAPLLTGYGGCAAKFGPHADSVAGDQYYHHAARALAYRLMRGEMGEARELAWAERGSLAEQARAMAERCKPAIFRWEAYLADCGRVCAALSAQAAQLLQDTLVMNAQLHLHSSRMMVALAQACACCERENWDEAFFRTGQALDHAEAAAAAMHAAEHGEWENYYGNDCFVNLRLTCDVLRSLRSFLRVTHDGPSFWHWERKHLMAPADKRIILQTHRHCQYSDDEMYARLKEKGVFSGSASEQPS